MCGVGVLMLLSAATPAFMDWFLGVLAVGPVIGYAVVRLGFRRHWKGAGWFAITFAVLLLIHRTFGGHVLAVALMYFIVGVTWASGLGYLFSVGKLRGHGRVTAGELVRLATSIALPALAVLAQSRADSPSWAIIAIIAFEMAHGGLDNLLSHNQAEASATSWGLRTGTECVCFLVAWLAPSSRVTLTACLVALAVSTLGLVFAFAQKRRFYLDSPAPSLPAKAAVV
jgi:hypothetical protein